MSEKYTTRRIVFESLPLLLAVALLSVISGQVLQGHETLLLSLPVFLLIVPAFVNQSGDIAAVLASRITTELYTGSTQKSVLKSDNLKGSVLGLLLSSSIGFTFLTILSYTVSMLLGLNTLPFETLWIIMLLSGITTILAVMFVGLIIAIITFRWGLDPDNFSAPVVTTTSDVIGIFLLFLFASLLGGI
ncbi:MAG: magnesium transporter [Promethearchaeota archaeon]